MDKPAASEAQAEALLKPARVTQPQGAATRLGTD